MNNIKVESDIARNAYMIDNSKLMREQDKEMRMNTISIRNFHDKQIKNLRSIAGKVYGK